MDNQLLNPVAPRTPSIPNLPRCSVKCLLFAGNLLAMIFAGNAQALSFAEVPPLETIASQSSLAFRGVVVGVDHADAQINPEQSTPYTITRVRAEVCYRGCVPGQELTIGRLGGPRHGDFHRYVMIPGVPSFALGDEVVLFANDAKHPYFGTLYGDYGALRVARGDGGEPIVMNYSEHPLAIVNGKFRVDGAKRCKRSKSAPRDCSMVSIKPAAEPSDAASSPLNAPIVTKTAFDRQIVKSMGPQAAAQSAQIISVNKQSFERALVDLYRRHAAR